MSKLCLRWGINTLAIWVVSHWVKGIRVEGAGPLLLAAALLGVLNALIRPLLLFLTLPINLFSLGFFTLIINGGMLYAVAYLVKGFEIQTFGSAVLGAFLISLISWVINHFFP